MVHPHGSGRLDVPRVAAAGGLPGVRLPYDDESRTLTTPALNLVVDARIEGLMLSALHSGVLVGSALARSDAEQAFLAAARRSLAAEAWALQTFEALDAAGIEARVLKGLAIAHLDHDDPSERVFADADILIRRADHRRALVALEAAGFRRVEPPVRMWWERRFGKAVMLRTPTGGELDLHLAITGGYFGARIDHGRLWSSASAPFDLGGRPTRGLDLEGRWLHACCHAVLGGGSGLRAQRDVAQLVLLSGVDWARAVEHAIADGVEAVIAEAVRMTWDSLWLDSSHPVAQWAAGYVADVRQCEALAGYRAASQVGWGPEGRSILSALSSTNRAAFLAGLAWPSRASRRQRGRSLFQHMWIGARSLRSPASSSLGSLTAEAPKNQVR